MSRITGGSVHVLRRVNLGNYEHKEAAVELTFGVNEDEDHAPILASASAEAHNHVEAILAGKLITKVDAVPGVGPTVTPRPRRGSVEKNHTDDSKPGVDPTVVAEEAISEAVKPADPTAMVDETPAAAAKAVVEIPDKSLVDACSAASKKTSNSMAIRALIGQYIPPPGRVSGIAQDKRQAFLDELAKVPVLAA